MDVQTTEREWVRRAQGGDRGALVELIEWARVKLFPVAYAELRHYDDAQDAVGSALLQICLHLTDLRDPTRIGAWMYSIVRNEARRLLRSRVPEAPGVLLDEVEAPAVFPSALLRIDVERALYRLPFDEARAVALFYLKGVPIREIAAYLERPDGTIKRWLHSGRKHLARELEAYAPMTSAMKRRLSRALIHSVGAHPTRVAANPSNGRIYVASGSGTVTVIDGAANAVTASVEIGAGVTGLAVNPETGRIYACRFARVDEGEQGLLAVINGDTCSLAATVAVGNTPRAVAVNPVTNKIYVAGTGENTVSVVDGRTDTVITAIPVGSDPVSLAVNTRTNRIYAANWGSCTVSVIDGASDTVIAVIAVGAHPMDVAADSNTNRVFVANSHDDTISVIDGACSEVAETVSVGRRPVGIAINARTNKIYVTHSPDEGTYGTLHVFDGDTLHRTAAARVKAGARSMVVDPDTNCVYIAHCDDAVSVIHAEA